MQHSFPKLIIGAASQAAPLVSSAASAAGEEALSPGADLHYRGVQERNRLRSHQQGGFSPWQMLFRSIVMTTESRNSISCPCYSRCWERIASQHSICWFVFVGAADVLDSMLYT